MFSEDEIVSEKIRDWNTPYVDQAGEGGEGEESKRQQDVQLVRPGYIIQEPWFGSESDDSPDPGSDSVQDVIMSKKDVVGAHTDDQQEKQGFGAQRGLMLPRRRIDEIFIIVRPGLIVIIDGRQVRIVENLQKFGRTAAGQKLQSVVPDRPTAFPVLPAFPPFGIAYSRFGFHIVVPDIFSALPVGSYIFAGDAAGVAAEAFVEIHDHGQLSSNLHTSSPPPPFAR